MKQLEHCVIARLRAGRERLVQALTAKTRILGELRHAAGARNVADGSEKHIRVWVFQGGRQILRDGFLVVQVIGSIKGGGLD